MNPGDNFIPFENSSSLHSRNSLYLQDKLASRAKKECFISALNTSEYLLQTYPPAELVCHRNISILLVSKFYKSNKGGERTNSNICMCSVAQSCLTVGNHME